MAVADQNEKSRHSGPPLSSNHHDPESGASSLSLGKDVAIGLVGEHARDIDPEVEARVLRKIDWFLIPAMIVGMLSSAALRSQHQHLQDMDWYTTTRRFLDQQCCLG